MEVEDMASDKLGLTQRACDHCRTRKIRCDRRSPCSNCRSSKLVCRTIGKGQKQSEPRRRVLISDQYERKIDMIEERLDGIEQALQDINWTIKMKHVDLHSRVAPPEEKIGVPSVERSSSSVLRQDDSSPTFEGNSSLAAHSAYASKFLETAVSQSKLCMSSPKIETALSTLRQIVNMQDQQTGSRGVRFKHQKPVGRSGLRELKMPPVEVVVDLLRKIKESPPSVFQCYFPFISVDYFEQKCREVYFATEDYSDATFIIVNGGLFHIFLDYGFHVIKPSMKSEYQDYLQLCKDNIETGLANINLLMPASEESIKALTLGAIYAIEVSKPSLAWSLSSTAAQLCQMLGYHLASSMELDSTSVQGNKLRLFWTVYCVDRGLSLRLGRASSIQDYDISVPLIFYRDDLSQLWECVYTLWIKLSRIQGKVYELLYSPAALCQPEADRVAHARRLAAEMEELVMKPFKLLGIETSDLTDLELHFLKSDEVSRLSILTLIYRAIPPSPLESRSAFIPDCIQTARLALESHHECMITLKESNEALKCSYMHWTILYSPFVPFIVIFCHIIESSDRTDLVRLEDFILSLQPISLLSEAIDKLYRLCHVLGTIARLYVEAKAQQNHGDLEFASVGQEFDSYLSALGLAPSFSSMATSGTADYGDSRWRVSGPAIGDHGNAGTGQDSLATTNQTMQLGNWFSGNQYIMGLLEEDLEIFNSL